MVKPQKEFGLIEYQAEQGRIIVRTPSFDFDSFPLISERLVATLSAHVIEKQCDADIHTWLIDFEDTQLFLRAEHYSESVWLEALNSGTHREEMDYLAGLFAMGFDVH